MNNTPTIRVGSDCLYRGEVVQLLQNVGGYALILSKGVVTPVLLGWLKPL